LSVHDVAKIRGNISASPVIYSFTIHTFRHLHRHINPARLAALSYDHLLNRNERGELRHQAILEAEVSNYLLQLWFHFALLCAVKVLAHQIVDTLPGPER
jgi:hypothetical protein